MDPAPLERMFNHAAALHGCGLPEERLARMAARQAFVEMKLCFMGAAAAIEGNTGAHLQRKVRLASEVIDLWRLRAALFAALPPGSGDAHRQELQQQLEVAFPEGGGNTAFVPL